MIETYRYKVFEIVFYMFSPTSIEQFISKRVPKLAYSATYINVTKVTFL